jgi:hypothetical protein
MGTTPYPVIADEQSKVRVPWRSSSITPEWLIDGVASFGWQFEESQLNERDLTIADGAGVTMPSPPIGLDGFPGVGGLPHLAYARMAVDGHSFSADGLWLFVEVTDITEHWSRQWADYILALGPAEPVPLGRGYALMQVTVIDAGDRLIRANWGYSIESGVRYEGEPSVKREVQLLSLQPQGG